MDLSKLFALQRDPKPLPPERSTPRSRLPPERSTPGPAHPFQAGRWHEAASIKKAPLGSAGGAPASLYLRRRCEPAPFGRHRRVWSPALRGRSCPHELGSNSVQAENKGRGASSVVETNARRRLPVLSGLILSWIRGNFVRAGCKAGFTRMDASLLLLFCSSWQPLWGGLDGQPTRYQSAACSIFTHSHILRPE